MGVGNWLSCKMTSSGWSLLMRRMPGCCCVDSSVAAVPAAVAHPVPPSLRPPHSSARISSAPAIQAATPLSFAAGSPESGWGAHGGSFDGHGQGQHDQVGEGGLEQGKAPQQQ